MNVGINTKLAIILLSGTAALASPVLAQEADTTTPLIQGTDQGSATTDGGAGEMNGGSTGDAIGGDAQAQSPVTGGTEQNTAEGAGASNDEAEAQTTQKPLDNKNEQDAAQSNDATTDKPTTAEADKATEDGAKTEMENAQGTDGGSDTKTQSAAGASTSDEDNAAADAGTSNETTASIDISTEQRTEIHNVIVESKAKPVDIDIDVSVGTTVPRTVELLPLPPRIIEIVPAYKAYKYILLSDGRILIVEPSSLKIVYVITA